MTAHQAATDPTLSARVRERRSMRCHAGASHEECRPPHVRAASRLSYFEDYLVVVQDEATWLALINIEDRVHALPCPASANGCRAFSASRGNRHGKFDPEARTTVAGEAGHERIGFGSGVRRMADADDETLASEIFDAELGAGFLAA